MMKNYLLTVAFLSIAFSTSASFADLLPGRPGPRPPRPVPNIEEPAEQPAEGITAPLVLRKEQGAKTAKIIIPKKFLADVEVGQVDDGMSSRTVLAGLIMSLAVGAAVVIGVRTRAAKHAAIVVVSGFLVAGGTAWADLRFDDEEFRKLREPELKVTIEVVDQGNAVTIVLPQ